MSFPHTIYGKFGDEKETSTSKRRALGTVLELPDGRQFKYALNGGTAIAAGALTASKVMVANHDMDLVTAATTAGSQTVTVTLGNTATTLNQYSDGYLYTNDGTAEGHIYRIKSNPVASGNATCVITLDDNDKIIDALDSTTLSGLLENPYNEVVISPTTVTCRTVGVTPTSLAASEYGYLQTKGLASVLVSGTVVAGEPLRVAGATTAGAAMALDRDGSGENEQEIGVVHNVVAVSTDYVLAFLNID